MAILKHRKFGQLDWEVSILGFGIMRLPHNGDDYGDILEEEASSILHYAIDNGVNYLDTAWNYHNGNSEIFLGKALRGGYREKVRIATKLPSWKIEKRDDFDIFFDEQMERLQIDHLDFYLLHALQRDWWDKVKNLGFLDWAEKKMADGAIGHIGFSFHDKFPLLKRIIDEYDNWTLALLEYNYMDIEYQAGKRGIQYASDNGLAVLVMEPLRGGLLAKQPPADVKKLFNNAPVQRTPADWSFQWLWNQKQITTLLSGMSTMEQLQQNIASACTSDVGTMSSSELELIEKVREAYEKRAPIPCTRCRYCMPCPQGVAIPWIFEYFNMSVMYEDLQTARAYYAFLGEDSSASLCNECGKCLEHCPQHIDIIALLKESHKLLAKDAKE